MTNFNDDATDILLAILDATATKSDDTLDECIDDARTAFFRIPDAEREPLRDAFEQLLMLIQQSHL